VYCVCEFEPQLVESGLPRYLALLLLSLSRPDGSSNAPPDDFQVVMLRQVSPPIGFWLSFAKQRLPFSGRGGCWVLNCICAFQQSGSLEFEANDGAAE
jgi:hypothetical protein